jgi:hypothetical protein
MFVVSTPMSSLSGAFSSHSDDLCPDTPPNARETRQIRTGTPDFATHRAALSCAVTELMQVVAPFPFVSPDICESVSPFPIHCSRLLAVGPYFFTRRAAFLTGRGAFPRVVDHLFARPEDFSRGSGHLFFLASHFLIHVPHFASRART